MAKTEVLKQTETPRRKWEKNIKVNLMGRVGYL